jgi:hypothetical protein
MSEIAISNVINVTVSTPPSGLAAYQVNNLAILTKEAPVNGALTASNPGIYVSPYDVGVDWGTGSEVYAMANLIFSQRPNILDGGGQLVIFPMAGGDSMDTFFPAAKKVVFFGGFLPAGYIPLDAEIIATATAAEANRTMYFASQYLLASLTVTTGVFAIIHAANQPQCRKLLYTNGGSNEAAARKFAAAYAARLMSVDYSGNATANTMHLKNLSGVVTSGGVIDLAGEPRPLRRDRCRYLRPNRRRERCLLLRRRRLLG